LLVPFGLVGIALLLLALVWERAQQRRLNGELANSRQIVASETVRATPAVAPVTPPVSATAPVSAAPVVPSPKTAGPVTPSPTVAPVQPKPGNTPEPAVAAAPVVTTQTASEPPATNSAPVPVVQPPKPILKLQSILFGSTKPSAMINGKPLFLGDRIGQFRVTAISEDSVTLVGAGQTNVLSLSQ
jgi:hypothetical protein